MNISDERIEIIIANLLRAGVLLSAAVVLIGGIGYLLHHGREVANYSHFHGAPEMYRKPAQVIAATLHGDWQAVIQLGLLLLIATPVARVAFSIVAFAAEEDATYVVVTLIVLAVLLYSLVGSQ